MQAHQNVFAEVDLAHGQGQVVLVIHKVMVETELELTGSRRQAGACDQFDLGIVGHKCSAGFGRLVDTEDYSGRFEAALTLRPFRSKMQMHVIAGSSMTCSERLLKEMRRRGVRVTPQRSVILETVSHLGGHPTALEVYRAASRRLPGLNQATVYRALEALREAGLVDGMDGAGGPDRFAVRDGDHPHHHLVCTNCGAEDELAPGWIEAMARRLRQRTGFRLHAQHLTFPGLCRACAERRRTG